MGRMRSALRAYAMLTSDPAEVLTLLDQKMQHFEPDALATVLYAVVDPALGRADMASAGHFPPVISRPGSPAELADVCSDVMIGVLPDAQRRVSAVRIEPGTALLFYTDGLIERPGEPIDDGLARLCQVVAGRPPEETCAAVMAAMVGRESARDDIALLALRRDPPATTRLSSTAHYGSAGLA